jgi:ubiquitin-protein ligase E3 C
LVPLRTRLTIFSSRLAATRFAHQGAPGPRQRRRDIVIHRDRDVFRECYRQVTAIASLGGGGGGGGGCAAGGGATALRDVFRVQFVSADGRRESGIDMGGLFKDLWTQISAVAFEPAYGLWTVSRKTASLYPRLSLSAGVMGSGVDAAAMFLFLGRVLGKAVYEGITVQPRFSHFFLTKLLGKRNQLNDLATLDWDLYKNLLFLKTYDGDVADLCLDFSVAEEDCGVTRVVDLRPGGRGIEVTHANRLRYILLVADYHLNKRIKAASDAFVRGFHSVVPVQMLRWFSPAELQTVISGPDGPIDVEELKRSTRYSGGYSSRSVSVTRFWKALGSMDHEERKLVVRFVTGCERAVRRRSRRARRPRAAPSRGALARSPSRPAHSHPTPPPPRPQPPLGWSQLEPKFCVHCVTDASRLPTAATCFNMLKLPALPSSRVMKEKLLFSAKSGMGFELS